MALNAVFVPDDYTEPVLVVGILRFFLNQLIGWSCVNFYPRLNHQLDLRGAFVLKFKSVALEISLFGAKGPHLVVPYVGEP